LFVFLFRFVYATQGTDALFVSLFSRFATHNTDTELKIQKEKRCKAKTREKKKL